MSDYQFIIFVSFVFLGAATFYFMHRKISYVKASARWPSVPGVIMHSHLSMANLRHGVGPDASDYSFPMTDIRYYYILNGRKYEGTRVTYTNHYPKDLVMKFRDGDKVRVYYDPNNPNKSVLISGCPEGLCDSYFTAMIFSGTFFAVAAGVYVFG